ncbi:Hsp20/alpha crystallin family protein [Chloroflexota bacterium]
MNITLYRNPARALSAWTPFYRPISLLDDIDQLARDFWSSWQPGFFGTTLVPHTDVYEEKGQLVVQTELPGITEKDLEVTLEGDVLTIKTERKEEVTEDATHHTGERYYGKYVRSMSLPTHVNGDKISATLGNGVLELRIPKAEEVKAKRIEVKAQLPQGERKQRRRKPKQNSS